MDYLREDGIVLPDDNEARQRWIDQDSGVFSDNHSEWSNDDEALLDPSEHFRDIHQQIKDTISELGGKVTPKLNWSAPKDATWIAASNSLECQRPSDIYLLLKSSDFITHDLQHAFEDCHKTEQPALNEENTNVNAAPNQDDFNYVLVLRKWVEMNPSVEFRCFVRSRTLLAICQRDLNHFEFLFTMVDQLRSKIQEFFETRIMPAFPDETFVFDVYIPPPHKRVWLIDINPWAPRTDPLLFSWQELLRMDLAQTAEQDADAVVSLPHVPELRLVKRDDPEAYSFTTSQFSSHKMPRDVVDASQGGPGPLREFADQWKDMLAQQQQRQSGLDHLES